MLKRDGKKENSSYEGKSPYDKDRVKKKEWERKGNAKRREKSTLINEYERKIDPCKRMRKEKMNME